MSTTSTNAGLAKLDMDRIEQGIQKGRRIRAEAFSAALKTLFSRQAKPEKQERATPMPDCTAAA